MAFLANIHATYWFFSWLKKKTNSPKNFLKNSYENSSTAIYASSKNIIRSIELFDYTKFFIMKSHISRWISKYGSFIISIMSKHNSVFAGLVKFRKLLAIKGISFLETACCPNFYIRNLVFCQ